MTRLNNTRMKKNTLAVILPVMFGFLAMGFIDMIGLVTNNVRADFNMSDGMVNTYTAQGMGSDDSYVYFPMSPKSGGGTDNILCTYDWEGKHVADLHIDLNMESESMFYAGGRYYVNFYSSGARLYQITPIIVFAP